MRHIPTSVAFISWPCRHSVGTLLTGRCRFQGVLPLPNPGPCWTDRAKRILPKVDWLAWVFVRLKGQSVGRYMEETSWTRGVAWKGLASRNTLGSDCQDIGTTFLKIFNEAPWGSPGVEGPRS